MESNAAPVSSSNERSDSNWFRWYQASVELCVAPVISWFGWSVFPLADGSECGPSSRASIWDLVDANCLWRDLQNTHF